MEQSSMVENSSIDTSNTPTSAPVAEEMISISKNKFNDTIRHSNARVAEKARQEERAKWEQQQPTQSAEPTYNSGMSPDEIRRIASEAAETKNKELVNFLAQQQ